MRVAVTIRLGRKEARERTRQELLAAAARVFAAKGFAGASVDDVAEAAGFTKGAVYSNFASKTDLMLALIEDRIRRQSEVIEDAFAGVSLEEGFRDLGARTSGPTALDREWMMLVGEFMLYAMRDERARVALAAEYERARGLSAALIASKYLAAGTTPPIPARDIAIIIEALGIGLGFQALIDPAGVSTDLEAVVVERLLGPGPEPAVRPGGAGARGRGAASAAAGRSLPGMPAVPAPGEPSAEPVGPGAPGAPGVPERPVKPERPAKPERPKGPGAKKPKGR